MSLELAMSVVIAFAVGFAVVSLFWPGVEPASPASLAFKVFLGLGVGHGITACLAYVFLVAYGAPDRSYIFCELLFLLGVVGLCMRARRTSSVRLFHIQTVRKVARVPNEELLAMAFCVAAAVALISIGIEMDRVPYGDWDAWAIYNVRARSIFRGGSDWRDSFSGLLFRSHPDYPLLLPLSVVRAWIYMGGESIAAPKLLGGVFMVATIGLVPSAISVLRGHAQAYIAGVVLLGNVFLLRHASSQYADVPLMYFYAATVSLMVLRAEVVHGSGAGVLALAGLAAGLAAWTKNEGTLFLVVLMVAHFVVVVRASGLRTYARQLLPLAAGLGPVLLVLVHFKLALAPPNDLVMLLAGQSVIGKLTDPGRYVAIAGELLRRAPLHDGFRISMVYVMAVYAISVGLGARQTAGVALSALTVALVCAGYFVVYLMTPNELQWHIDTSMDRLLLQVWPMFVLAFFLAVSTPEEVFGPARNAPGKSARR